MAERDAMLWHRIYALLGYFNNGMWRATRALDNLISLPLKLEFNFSISIERNGATTTNCVYCFLFRRKVRRCAWSWPTAHDSQEHDVSPDCVLPKKNVPRSLSFAGIWELLPCIHGTLLSNRIYVDFSFADSSGSARFFSRYERCDIWKKQKERKENISNFGEGQENVRMTCSRT